MINLDELFWNASLTDLKKGYAYQKNEKQYICLLCGEHFEQGRIYPFGTDLFDARKAVQMHLEILHPPLVEYYLNLDKKLTGLTDAQKNLLEQLLQLKSDREIAHQLGTSTSTVRNHRFNLRQKEKQAKIMLAVLELFSEHTLLKKQEMISEVNSESISNNIPEWISIHRGATMVDERYAITEKENQEVLKAYFPQELQGRLKEFPRKEKRKLIIIRHIAANFQPGQLYTEKEVNRLLLSYYDDFATLRRYLVEYGYLDRERDCSYYWVNQEPLPRRDS